MYFVKYCIYFCTAKRRHVYADKILIFQQSVRHADSISGAKWGNYLSLRKIGCIVMLCIHILSEMCGKVMKMFCFGNENFQK